MVLGDNRCLDTRVMPAYEVWAVFYLHNEDRRALRANLKNLLKVELMDDKRESYRETSG